MGVVGVERCKSDDGGIDLDDFSEQKDSDYLKELSAVEMIEEIQSRVDHVTEAVIFANQNMTFGDSDQAQRLVNRMEQLTCAFESSLSSLQHLEHEIRNLRKRQGKVTGFFQTRNKKRNK